MQIATTVPFATVSSLFIYNFLQYKRTAPRNAVLFSAEVPLGIEKWNEPDLEKELREQSNSTFKYFLQSPRILVNAGSKNLWPDLDIITYLASPFFSEALEHNIRPSLYRVLIYPSKIWWCKQI